MKLLIAGGGVLYAKATNTLRRFVDEHGVPVAETQAGKGSLPWDHPLQLGAIGVSGSPAANSLAPSREVQQQDLRSAERSGHCPECSGCKWLISKGRTFAKYLLCPVSTTDSRNPS